MMPVPAHLQGIVVPKDSEIDESHLDGDVVCTCGSHRFVFFYPGETQEWQGEVTPCTAKINGKFYFVVRTKCSSCAMEWLLFDKDFHGWDGFVCHDNSQAALPRPQLVAWKCLDCGGNDHESTLQIQTEGKEDFVSEGDGKFDEKCWPEGFSWITISLKCVKCGKNSPEWVSYETM